MTSAAAFGADRAGASAATPGPAVAAAVGRGRALTASSASRAIASFSYRNSTGCPAAIVTAARRASLGPLAAAQLMSGLTRRIAEVIMSVISPGARPRWSASS